MEMLEVVMDEVDVEVDKVANEVEVGNQQW